MPAVKRGFPLYAEKEMKNKLTDMTPKDKILKIYEFYTDGSWVAKIQAQYTDPKLKTSVTVTAYGHYFINGYVHISGKGVKKAISDSGGKYVSGAQGVGGYGFKSLYDRARESEGNGHAKNQITLYKECDVKSIIIGKLYKGILVHMSKFELKKGWCYMVGTGDEAGNGKKNVTLKGWGQYQTKIATNVEVNKVTKGKIDVKDLNNRSNIDKDDPSENPSENSSENPSENSSENSSENTSSESTPSRTMDSETGLDDETGKDMDYSAFTKYKTVKASAFVQSVRGIYGMPYQFTRIVDPKLTDEKGKESLFGAIYAERILARMPLLIVSPGKPVYMPNYANEDVRNSLVEALAKSGIDKIEKTIEKIGMNKDGSSADGKFYSFDYDYKEYFKYVNAMCQQMSIYLGVHDETMPLNNGKEAKLSDIEWQDYQNSYICDTAAETVAVGFYIDSESSFSESFSNNTQESQFASAINGMNDLSREIQFLMGGASGVEFQKLIDDNFSDALSQFDDFLSKYTQVFSSLLVSRLKNTFETIKIGGQLVFPEIWNDSDFARSYDVNIKLRTPDGDNLSWFLNIGVPLCHLLCLTVPKRLGYNGIQSPFLVRAFYKGFFNVDMGIISSMSINRGDKCKWTLQGLPTDVDISLNIKDLYQSLSIAKVSDLVRNTCQLDYVANLCGININKPDAQRAALLAYKKARLGIITAITDNGFLGVNQAIDNFKLRMYEKYFK